jgi:hypothetical protein
LGKAKLLGGYNQIRLVYAWTFSLPLFSLSLCMLPVEGQERIGPFLTNQYKSFAFIPLFPFFSLIALSLYLLL